jgi:type IV pilus assembly protein PilM
MATIIGKLHKEARISGKDIAIALPEALVFTRVVTFPLLTDQEISSAIKWEAEQYIPIPIDEAIIQYQIVSRNEKATPPTVQVLLIAAPRTLVEKYVKVCQMAGLNVARVETELLALTRALAPIDKTSMLIDFGAKSTDIAITNNGLLSFSRSISTAGEAFTRAVAQNLNIEYKQAEEYKKTYGLSGGELEGKIKGALDPVFSIIGDEIKKAIYYYQTEEKGSAPTSIVLSGGTSGMPEAISYLTKQMNIEIVVGNPFAKVNVDSEVAKSLAPYAPLYSIAVGVALGGE